MPLPVFGFVAAGVISTIMGSVASFKLARFLPGKAPVQQAGASPITGYQIGLLAIMGVGVMLTYKTVSDVLK